MFKYARKARRGALFLTVLLAAQLSVGPLLLAPPVAAKPTLTVLGERYFEHGVVYPINGTIGDSFFLAIKYQSSAGLAPKAGYPKALIDTNGDGDFNDSTDYNLSMAPMKSENPNYFIGVDYGLNWVPYTAGTYSVAFYVVNTNNETAYIGPFDGPVVVTKPDVVPSNNWTTLGLYSLLIFVMCTVFFVLGMAAGQSSERKIKKQRHDELRRIPK